MKLEPRMISLVEGCSGRTVVWVDDRVMLTRQNLHNISADSRHKSLNEKALWAIPASYGKALATLRAFAYGDEAFHASARKIIEVCNIRGHNLKLVDFRTAHSIIRADHDCLYLFDLQNITEALGFTDLGEGKTDENWIWAIYGAELAKHYQIPPHRFRFASRYSGERGISDSSPGKRTEDIVLEALKQIYPDVFKTSADIYAHSVRLDDSLEELALQMNAFLTLNGHHKNPKISDAIAFALSPPGGRWEHNELKPKNQSKPQGAQCVAFAKWLNTTIECESALALLLAPNRQDATAWSVDPINGRTMSADVLRALCVNLGVKLEVNSSLKELYLPMQPGFPFLLAFAALMGEMADDPDYYEPTKVAMDSFNDGFSLRVYLNPKVAVKGKKVSATKFCAAYASGLAQGVKNLPRAERLVSLHVVRLAHGIVDLEGEVDATKMSFFTGTSSPVVDVLPDEQAHVINIIWPRKP